MLVPTAIKHKLNMTVCTVFDKATNESDTFYSLTGAKKWMKERMKLGHGVEGYKYKVYSNGDTVNNGRIVLQGSNKSFVANSKQKKPGY